jgi:FKBP-type peptidyl-prolyl cis-trans isomerase (trigger factor)
VGEKEVEEAITSLLYDAATLEEEDIIEGKNLLLEITVTPVDEATGVPLVGARSHNAKLNFRDPRVNPEIIEKSQGLRVGDAFRMKVQNTETKNMEEVLFSINEIHKLVPAELNDNFVEQLTQAQLSSVDELREQVRLQLTQEKEAFAQRQLSQDIVNTLVVEHKFNVSERYMRVVLDRMLQEFASQYPEGKIPQSINIQQVAQEMFPEVFVRARWDIISHRIADREGIRLEEDDLRSEAEILARQYNIDVDTAMQYIKGAPAATLTLAQEKVLDFIKDNNDIADVEDAAYATYQQDKMKWLEEKTKKQAVAAEQEAGQSSSLILDPSEQPKTSGNIIV